MNPVDEVYFSLKKVAQRYTSSPRKIYRLLAGDGFPKPVTIGGSKKWALSDLMNYEERLRNKGENQ
jgi:predicted DNA-binding transcriptional regulator AlpA